MRFMIGAGAAVICFSWLAALAIVKDNAVQHHVAHPRPKATATPVPLVEFESACKGGTVYVEHDGYLIWTCPTGDAYVTKWAR